MFVSFLLQLACAPQPSDGLQWRQADAHEHRSRALRMVPPVRIPQASAQTDVEIWISHPEGTTLGRLEDSEPVFDYPAGTIADRVEYKRTKTGRRVVDVRGSTVETDGRRWDHVYKPVSTDPNAELLGARWPADDAAAQKAAIDGLMSALEARGNRHTASIRKKLDCNRCHGANRPDNLVQGQHGLVNRGTDSMGFFTPRTLFRSSLPLERYGLDPNQDDPFIEVSCADGRTPTIDKHASCPQQRTALARLDVERAVAASDPHALAFVESRTQLRQRLETP